MTPASASHQPANPGTVALGSMDPSSHPSISIHRQLINIDGGWSVQARESTMYLLYLSFQSLSRKSIADGLIFPLFAFSYPFGLLLPFEAGLDSCRNWHRPCSTSRSVPFRQIRRCPKPRCVWARGSEPMEDANTSQPGGKGGGMINPVSLLLRGGDIMIKARQGREAFEALGPGPLSLRRI